MSASNFGNIQYKASNGQINLDEAQGIVECFVAGIGNKDSVGDICATGAFAKSLQRRKPRVVWGHNWNDPIGKVLEIYEVPVNDPRLPMKMKMAGIGGLYAKVQFNLQSEKGREAFANVAFFGEEQEWSIGYKTLRAQFDQNLQANVLYEVELYEVSPVLHGANQLTGTISVKSDEEKMHGMMPLVIGAPSAGKPSDEGIFEEGLAQRISGSQLAGVVAELSRRAGGPVMVVDATENSVVFIKPGKGKFRIGYHFTGTEYMFGKPELIQSEQAKPTMQSGPAPMPGISAKPTSENKPAANNPAMPMPVAMKPGDGGMVMVPLPPVKYESGEEAKKPELVAEERELAESLVRIAGKYGKFDEDGDGIWAGYYPPAENKVKDIGVKCSNCVLYQGNGKCKILDMQVEDDGKCRFAIIPDGVVVGFGKKEYNDLLDEDEVKMVEDIEAKYPGEFILGAFRNVVKKRRKKRKSYKTLEEWGIEEQELAEKGLDPFLAHDASYVIPVNPEDAFAVKSILDPVFEYHRIDTVVNEYGIVINSPLDQESKDAIQTAAISAYGFLKKKLETENIEEKALGRRIASRAIDRPNIGGKRRRGGGRGFGIPSGDLDPRTRRDSNLDGTLFDNIPGWEQPDPTPNGPGSINNPTPSRRQLQDRVNDGKKLSSGKRNERRHADRSADMEAKFPNPDEAAKRKLQEDIADQWISQGFGWEEVPRYNADKGKSSDYLRGRELGVNQSRLMWQGDDNRRRPKGFDEKKRSSSDYASWYESYAQSVANYIDANAKEGDDNWNGIEEALKTEVYEKRPDTSTWRREDADRLGEMIDNLGLGINKQRGVRSSLKDREPAPLSSGKKKPKKMPSDKEIYDRRMAGETLQEVADDLGVDRTDVRKAEQRHMAGLRKEGGKVSSGKKYEMQKFNDRDLELIDSEFDRMSEADKDALRKDTEDFITEQYGIDSSDPSFEEIVQNSMDSSMLENISERNYESEQNRLMAQGESDVARAAGAARRRDEQSGIRDRAAGGFSSGRKKNDYLNDLTPKQRRDIIKQIEDDAEEYEIDLGRGGAEGLLDATLNIRDNDKSIYFDQYNDLPFNEAFTRAAFDYLDAGGLDETEDDYNLFYDRGSGFSSGRQLTDREEMAAADESLKKFLDGFDGWDDEEWEFDNQLDGAVERWASANEDMPWINGSVEDMIDEMSLDDSVEGQNKLAFLQNLQQSLFDAQYRARSMSDDERSRDRLERSVRRSQRDFDEGIFSSGRKFESVDDIEEANNDFSARGTRDLDPYERVDELKARKADFEAGIKQGNEMLKGLDEDSPEYERLANAIDEMDSNLSSVDDMMEEMVDEKIRLEEEMSKAAVMVGDVEKLRKKLRNIDDPTEEDLQELGFDDANSEFTSLANDITDVTDEHSMAVDWTVEKESDIEQALKDGDYDKAREILDDVIYDMANTADDVYRRREAEHDDYPFVGNGLSSGRRSLNELSDSEKAEQKKVVDWWVNRSGAWIPESRRRKLSDDEYEEVLAKTPELHIDYVDPETGATHNDLMDFWDNRDKEEVIDELFGSPTEDDLDEVYATVDWGLEASGPYGEESDYEPTRDDLENAYYEQLEESVSFDDMKKIIGREKRESGLSSGALDRRDRYDINRQLFVDGAGWDASEGYVRKNETTLFDDLSKDEQEEVIKKFNLEAPTFIEDLKNRLGEDDEKGIRDAIADAHDEDVSDNVKRIKRNISRSASGLLAEMNDYVRTQRPREDKTPRDFEDMYNSNGVDISRLENILDDFGTGSIFDDAETDRIDEYLDVANELEQIRKNVIKTHKRDIPNQGRRGRRGTDDFSSGRTAVDSEGTPPRKFARMMQMDPKNSKLAREINYDPQNRELIVNYRDGRSEKFKNVDYERVRKAGFDDTPDLLINELRDESGTKLSSGRRNVPPSPQDFANSIDYNGSTISMTMRPGPKDSIYLEINGKNVGRFANNRAADIYVAQVMSALNGRDSLSSGRSELGSWEKTPDGAQIDAPGIDGMYSIAEGTDGKFYVTRTYDAIREGGQYQMDFEHDSPFDSLADAKKWAEKDYDSAANAWNYDMVYGADESDTGFSSGRARSAASVFNVDPLVNADASRMLGNRDVDDNDGMAFSSGRTRGQRAAARLPKVNATDKEIFERRMEGASLEDVANELGVPRHIVRQAEQRHMARMRGTLDTPVDSTTVQDYKDVEEFARDMARIAEIEAAQQRADELFHARVTAGEDPEDIANEYGVRVGEVIDGAQRHEEFLKDLDRQAEAWAASQGETLSSGRARGKFRNPMGGMFNGEHLSSGKQDEVYKAVQDRLVQMLENADPDSWEFPWHKTGFVPNNPTNKKRPYSGVNMLMLLFAQEDKGYGTPMWAGFEQWKKMGGTVRKGEKGTQIFIPTIVPPKKDKDGTVVKEGFTFFKVGYVFNVDQVDGIDVDSLKGEELDPAERVQELEDALAEVGAIVKTGTDGRAFYRPSTDEISMPPFESFKSKEGYYAVLAHEMMHWTGHSSRLNRPNMNMFGDEAYAQEELIAEIAAAFFLAALGVSAEPREDHAKYLKNWLRTLKNDPNALQKAFSEAQKASDFVIGKSPKMQKRLGKVSTEKGVVPGNKDLVPGMPDVPSATLSSGRAKEMLDANGERTNLARILDMPEDEVLGGFKGFERADGSQYFAADSDIFGKNGRWKASKDSKTGKWIISGEIVDDYYGAEDGGISYDDAGVNRSFESPREMAKFIKEYEDERRAFSKAYNDAIASGDMELVGKLLNEDVARIEAERDARFRELAERSAMEQREDMELSWEEISRQFDEETASWSAEDWQDHADDLRMELDREDRLDAERGFGSGRVSRYNDADPSTIPSVKGAAGRDDEIGSNTRHIAKNVYAPSSLYDLEEIRANGNPISFTYKGEKRTIYPTGIKAKKQGGIYFVGVDEASGQYRSFNLEKVEGLVDGAELPVNPRQPGVAKGEGRSFSSGRTSYGSRIPDDFNFRPYDGSGQRELEARKKRQMEELFGKIPKLNADQRADLENRKRRNRQERFDNEYPTMPERLMSSGRKKRSASSKRRPMSPEEMQAFRDGQRLRARTIPGKKKSGPDASEFSSGRKHAVVVTPDDISRVRRYFDRRQPVSVGTTASNDMYNPVTDDWQVPVAPLLEQLGIRVQRRDPRAQKGSADDMIAVQEDSSVADLAEMLALSKAEAEKLLEPNASIPRLDMLELLQEIYFPGTINTRLDSEFEAQADTDKFATMLFGWNAAPYWYDRDGYLLTREEFEGNFEEKLFRDLRPAAIPDDMPDEAFNVGGPRPDSTPDAPLAPRPSSRKAGSYRKQDFTIQQLADFLGVSFTDRKAFAAEIAKRTGGKIKPTLAAMQNWEKGGVPDAYAEAFKKLGIIQSAEEIWGDAGRAFDEAMEKSDYFKRLDELIKAAGVKARDSQMERIHGMGGGTWRKSIARAGKERSVEEAVRIGTMPKYSDTEIGRNLDRVNEELGTNFTLDDIRGATLSSGRRAQRRISRAGAESAEALSSGSRENNGAPDFITPRMQNEIMDWARKNKWSSFATSLLEQYERDGFLTARQWEKLLRFVDTQKMKR